jgi:hypothetical protein
MNRKLDVITHLTDAKIDYWEMLDMRLKAIRN